MTLGLVVTDNGLMDKIMKSIITQLNGVMNKMRSGSLDTQVQVLLSKAFLASPEIDSLNRGELKKLFGIDANVDNLVNAAIVNPATSIYTITYSNFRRSGTNISGGVKITFSLDRIDALRAALGNPNWFEALTEKGDAEIEIQFVMGPNIFTKYTRVPPQFSGTNTNNFISRAINSVIDDVGKILESEFIRNATV